MIISLESMDGFPGFCDFLDIIRKIVCRWAGVHFSGGEVYSFLQIFEKFHDQELRISALDTMRGQP